MNILEVRPEQIIFEKDGEVQTRPNSPYYSMRHVTYKGNRIAYTFSDKSYVMETFDERIFNCWNNGQRLQFRQDLSDRLALAIKFHEDYLGTTAYDDLFKEAFNEIPNWDILHAYLKNIEDVRYTRSGYKIHDGDFKIDFKGNAWTTSKFSETLDNWNSLCIVMQGKGHTYLADGGVLPDSNGEMTKINALTMTILSKIMFLLNPNLSDKVFTNQLSESVLSKLRQYQGGENE